MLIVRNIRGTQWRTCACGSWRSHHVNFTGSRRTVCSVIGCTRPADVGAHVHDVVGRGGNDWDHYIALMCTGCNMSNNDLPLKSSAQLVTANIQVCTTYSRRRG